MITVLAVCGGALSLYMFMVERAFEKNAGYKAVCDISDKISCTAALKSRYGKPFGISNALLGVLFYPTLLLLQFYGFTTLIFYASLAAVLASCGLAFVLYFKIKVICLVCTSIYLINILLLVSSYMMQ
jgi:vitamin-K-epoxide reductase (warfarin-sensitive)